MRRLLFVLVLALPVPLAAAARGGSLDGGPFVLDTTQSISCVVSNLGTKPLHDLVMEVVRFDPGTTGDVVLANTPAELLPLRTTNAAITNGDGTAYYVCRFSWRGSGKAVRASALVYANGGELLAALPAH